jgi:RNA polymerase sigma-32 factor
MQGRWIGATAHAKQRKYPNTPPLASAEEERGLVEGWKQGNRLSGERLVRSFLPFVVSIAVEYRRWNVPMDDIVQQGCLGLLRAATRFDPAQGVRLVTYAAYWIRAEIRDYVLRCYRIVRLGTTKAERRALRCYRTTMDQGASKLAEMSGLSLARTEILLPILSAADVSIDAAANEGGTALHDRLPASEPSPEDSTIRRLDGRRTRRSIMHVLHELSSREQMIARERWLRETPMTLEALGVRLGVTKERVRQIEDRTRQKIKARLVELKVA